MLEGRDGRGLLGLDLRRFSAERPGTCKGRRRGVRIEVLQLGFQVGFPVRKAIDLRAVQDASHRVDQPALIAGERKC
jgi:hypothetical protein